MAVTIAVQTSCTIPVSCRPNGQPGTSGRTLPTLQPSRSAAALLAARRTLCCCCFVEPARAMRLRREQEVGISREKLRDAAARSTAVPKAFLLSLCPVQAAGHWIWSGRQRSRAAEDPPGKAWRALTRTPATRQLLQQKTAGPARRQPAARQSQKRLSALKRSHRVHHAFRFTGAPESTRRRQAPHHSQDQASANGRVFLLLTPGPETVWPESLSIPSRFRLQTSTRQGDRLR